MRNAHLTDQFHGSIVVESINIASEEMLQGPAIIFIGMLHEGKQGRIWMHDSTFLLVDNITK